MKKILFLSLFLVGLYSATAQDYYMTAPEGFGEAATGGGTPTTSNTVTVTDWTSLYAAMNSNKVALEAAKVILVSGTITMPATHTSVTIKNKTIIGLPGARLVNTIQATTGSGILYIKPGSNNVIIRNLIFEGPGAWDVDGEDNLTNEGTNIWVDHCEFQDGMDGNFDNKGEADNVTVSWCKFTYLKPPKTTGYVTGGTPDHRFSDLIGSDKTDFNAGDGHYSITFKNCYWAEGCVERMPRARNAELHILNCYYNSSVGKVAVGLGGGNKNTTCYIENSDFAKVKNVFTSYASTDGGTIALTYDGCIKGIPSTVIANSGTATKPTYTYTVLPVADVVTYVTDASCGAGATLTVDANGVITACSNLGVEDHVAANTNVRLYPTPVDTVLNIDLSNTASGDVVVDIYSMNGGKVYSFSKKDASSGEELALNLAGLAKGLYLCNITIDGVTTTEKFIKK